MSTSTSKPITIEHKNLDAIDEVLRGVEGRHRSFTVCANQLAHLASEVETLLEKRGIPQRLRRGVVVTYNPHCIPNSYRGNPKGTEVRIVRGSEKWRFLDATMRKVPNRTEGIKANDRTITFPASAREELLAALLRKAGMSIEPAHADG